MSRRQVSGAVQSRHDGCTACFSFWLKSDRNNLFVEELVDNTLKGYYFYPEPEWKKYGIVPPEKFPLVGSWRNIVGSIFVFLLECSPKDYQGYHRQVLLYLIGNQDEILLIENKISLLKTSISRFEKKELQAIDTQTRITDADKSKSVSRLLAMIGIFTAIVNAFSLYLRTLPKPDGFTELTAILYSSLILIIHFLSLGLLIVMVIICIFYVIRYGILVLKRL